MKEIPKIIHYCWFGHNKLPEKSIRYINDWKIKCPNYKIIKWSEINFDINKYLFTKKAYMLHDWAAISDYVRLIVLYKYGGIYLDTDVEVLKSLSPLLKNKSFIGMEDYGVINSGLIYGVKPHDDNIYNLIKIYNFISHKKEFSYYMNDQVHITTNYFHKYGFNYNNNLQIVNHCVIYPTEYFCPELYGSHKLSITKNTYTIHHYFGTWTNKHMFSRAHLHFLLRKCIRIVFGTKIFFMLYRRHLNNKKGNI